MVTPCDVCGNIELNWDRDWHVSDEEWERIVPEPYKSAPAGKGGMICPWCFVEFARQKGYQYKVRFINEIAFGVEKTTMNPSPPRIMPKAMQIETLKRIFRNLNPGVGVDVVDWEGLVDEGLTLDQNRVELAINEETMIYKWFSDETEERSIKRKALGDLEDELSYMLTIVPPEAQDHFRKIFDDYASRVRYSIERKLPWAKLNREVKDLRKQLEQAKKTGAPPPEPPRAPRPFTWTTTLERKLRDVFEAALTRAGINPRKFLPEYRLELDIIKTLTTEDDMIKAVEALAQEIILREKARKVTPPRIVEKPPIERVPAPPPWEEREIEPWVGIAEPQYPPQPMSEMPFPRLPAGIELDIIEDRFLYDLMQCGIYRPEAFLPQFQKAFAGVLFKSWADMRRGYDLLVETICKGLEVRYPYELRALPYESIEDAVYWLVSLKQFESAEDIAAHLHELGTPTTTEEVKQFIRKGYEQRVPNFVIVTKQYLEQLLGEPLD